MSLREGAASRLLLKGQGLYGREGEVPNMYSVLDLSCRRD